MPELAPSCAGVELADSWAVDLHKSLNAPFDAGVVLVRDRSTLVQAMAARGAYLPAQSGHWEPSDSTPELSRR
ncbi:pyridoxal-dependent decarboxylase, partial [Staphylococcus pasteuri_A]